MTTTPVHYGWLVSPYSAKTRLYLRHKQIGFDDRHPTLFTLRFAVQRAVGRMIMPTVRLPDGRWLQDSSDIITHFEEHKPERSVIPVTPKQRLTALLIELYADEWLPMAALHYRWNTLENERFALDEFARTGLPSLPAPLGRLLVGPVARRMQSYLPALGVVGPMREALENATTKLIADLQSHLDQHPYLLGGRPSLADFSLHGPLWAHLYRDPGSRYLFDKAPAVVNWFQRLEQAPKELEPWPAGDTIPTSLEPVLAPMLRDMLPWLTVLLRAIDRWCKEHPSATRVPRALGREAFSIDGQRGERKLITFVQYKAQRMLAAYHGTTGVERSKLDSWLSAIAQSPVVFPQVRHPFERVHFQTRLANA